MGENILGENFLVGSFPGRGSFLVGLHIMYLFLFFKKSSTYIIRLSTKKNIL